MINYLKTLNGRKRKQTPYTTYRASARLGGGALPLTQQVSA